MNSVNFFGNSVSRLIIGDNPMTGHSYIEDRISGQEMKNWYTAERLKEAFHNMEQCGYNTMLPLADPYIMRVLQEYQLDGGNLKFIWQPYMPMDQEVSMRMMKQMDTIGIYHQGTTTDFLYENGRADEIKARIAQYRKLGVPVGLGTHRPDVIELSENEGWDVDFYVACLQNARRDREGEPSGFITGKTKAKLLFYPEDRPVMLDLLQKLDKPVITYKIFAGGQMFLGKTHDEIKQLIKGVYEEVFSALKPDDLAAIGVFQRDCDQIRENAELYREWYENRTV